MKTLLLVVILVLLATLLVASLKPDSFKVERSICIKGSPDKIFTYINNFHMWVAWSPWEGIDSQLQRQYNHVESGVDAMYSWMGNKKVGQGQMLISESTPNQSITIHLNFIKPFKAQNITQFKLIPEQDGICVSWQMSGANSIIAKVMGLFVNMDHMIGKDFEAGLSKLKKVVEQEN